MPNLTHEHTVQNDHSYWLDVGAYSVCVTNDNENLKVEVFRRGEEHIQPITQTYFPKPRAKSTK